MGPGPGDVTKVEYASTNRIRAIFLLRGDRRSVI